MISSTRKAKVKFSEGDRVLCYEPDPTKAKVLYDSKVLEVEVNRDNYGRKITEYLIHFSGWSSSWDRVVKEEFILPDTEENRKLQRRLAKEAATYLKGKKKNLPPIIRGSLGLIKKEKETPSSSQTKNAIKVKEKKSSSESSSSDEETDSSISIKIPDALYTVLEQDKKLVTQQGKVIKLPCQKNALFILESYVKYVALKYLPSNEKKSNIEKSNFFQDIEIRINFIKEVVDGLRIYFDFNLPRLLLYKEERKQFHYIGNAIVFKKPSRKKCEDEHIKHCSQCAEAHYKECSDCVIAHFRNCKNCAERHLRHCDKCAVQHLRECEKCARQHLTECQKCAEQHLRECGKCTEQHLKDCVKCCEQHFTECSKCASKKVKLESTPSDSGRQTKTSPSFTRSTLRSQMTRKAKSSNSGSISSRLRKMKTPYKKRNKDISLKVKKPRIESSPRRSLRSNTKVQEIKEPNNDPEQTAIKAEESDNDTNLKSPKSPSSSYASISSLSPNRLSSQILPPVTINTQCDDNVVKSPPFSPTSSTHSMELKDPESITYEDILLHEIMNWEIIPEEEIYAHIPVPPSIIYGAHHLLRLFVRLPALLSKVHMPGRKLELLLHVFADFLDYMVLRKEEFFSWSLYINASEENYEDQIPQED